MEFLQQLNLVTFFRWRKTNRGHVIFWTQFDGLETCLNGVPTMTSQTARGWSVGVRGSLRRRKIASRLLNAKPLPPLFAGRCPRCVSGKLTQVVVDREERNTHFAEFRPAHLQHARHAPIYDIFHRTQPVRSLCELTTRLMQRCATLLWNVNCNGNASKTVDSILMVFRRLHSHHRQHARPYISYRLFGTLASHYCLSITREP